MSVQSDIKTIRNDLSERLENQKQAFLADPMPSLTRRIHRLDKLHNAILNYRGRLKMAVNQDFGNRSDAETDLAEIFPLLDGIAYYRKRLRKLMKPERRHTPLTLMPGKVEVRYQPLGVVGIVVPWNFPIFLALSPLVGALAAGNRAMLKASEFAPETGKLMQAMLSEVFDENEVSMVTGGVDVATEFTKLPFDHLVFTGSTQVGKIVMRAAAENLTPVTLELGGKSPVILHEDFPIKEAARRIIFGKSLNAGQVCVSPDYILCPRTSVKVLTESLEQAYRKSYPSIAFNEDVTSIITERQKTRLEGYLEDAEKKGATLRTVAPQQDDFKDSGKLPFTLILNPTDEMKVMQDEIFGPVLPIIAYDDLDSAIDYVNARPRPLALYYFDYNQCRASDVLSRTHSGGACINDTMSQVMADDIPFGGIGPSGMGHYHGREGFKTFSKAKGIVRKGRINATNFIAPPWNNVMFKSLMQMQEMKFRKRNV